MLSDIDENDSQSEDRLTLMTVHSAKGLEFRVVFVVGMEETLFPSQMSMDSPRGLEEERRLFYVAITRAEEFLIITHAKSRFRYGKTEFCEPSRFLREIDPRFLRVKGAPMSGIIKVPTTTSSSSSSSSSSVVRQMVPTGIDARRFVRVKPTIQSSGVSMNTANSSTDVPPVSIGTRILHERFGAGVVTAIEGSGIDAKATVNFQNLGIKQLLLRFAKFKIEN